MIFPRKAVFCLAVLAFSLGSLVDLSELVRGRQPSMSRRLPFAISFLLYNALFDRPGFFPRHEITLGLAAGGSRPASIWEIPGHYNRVLFMHRWAYPGSRLPELLLRHFYCEKDDRLASAKWVVTVPGEAAPAFSDEFVCRR